jgi:hypothetical protein
MPSPVSFNVQLAPLPANFRGTPAQWAAAVAARLQISPNVPWSSFQNGGAIPASDVGPVLYEGQEWRVWNPLTGSYTFHRQNGAGLVDKTVTKAKMADGTAGGILIYDAAGRPIELPIASGTDGQVLTKVGTTPVWADTFVPGIHYFEATASTSQDLNTNGSVQVVQFDTVRAQANVVFDTTNFRVPVVAGEVWNVYSYLQIEDNAPASTDVQVQLDIRVSGASTGVSTVFNAAALGSRFGMGTSGIIKITADGYLDVAVTPTETTPAADGLVVAGNATNTRFGGFRIV